MPAAPTPRRSPARLGILLSGRGSNFAAIADAIDAGTLAATIAVVVSDRPQAPGLARARQRHLAALALPPSGSDRAAYDAALVAALREHAVEWVCLAGFMRLLGPGFVAAFPQRILNIHPALLPAFPGLHAQRQALEYGVQFTGCTVHLVDDTVDGGPILLQAVVPVLAGDTEATLAARILEQEHRIYPEAIRRAIAGGWQLAGRRVVPAPGTTPPPAGLCPA